jgi:cytochrome c oxidase assembly protein subunit 15
VTSLVANIVIVATGAAVRLSDSGLGCPTWPRCTDRSLVAHRALGIHGVIEFGNRMLGVVLALIALVTFLAAVRFRPVRRDVRVLALVLALGVPAQALIGGVTVRTDLNPWVVSLHLLTSLLMVALAVVLVRRVKEEDRPPRPTVPPFAVLLGRATVAVGAVVLYLGTVVTGSGPHAGDRHSHRNGLDPRSVSELHANAVFLFVGLTIGCLVTFRATNAPERAVRAVTTLLGVELVQGAVGFTQYFTGLPAGIVEVHVVGASLVAGCLGWLLMGLRERGVARAPVGQAPVGQAPVGQAEVAGPRRVADRPEVADRPRRAMEVAAPAHPDDPAHRPQVADAAHTDLEPVRPSEQP